jgi:hypothetical protein
MKIYSPESTIRFCGKPEDDLNYLDEAAMSYLKATLKCDKAPAVPAISRRDWNKLDAMLNCHFIKSFLYYKTARMPRASKPPDHILKKWGKAFLSSRVRTLNLEIQLREILDAFNANHIPLLILKGPALGFTAYPDPAIRPYSDLDLLVNSSDMQISRNILEKTGYQCMTNRHDVSRDFYCEETFLPTTAMERKLAIELHWDLDTFSGANRLEGIPDLFDRAVEIKTPAITFRSLHPVDALVHRALKNTFHHDDDMRLIWILDIALLAGKLSVPSDWILLQKRCVDWHARFALQYSFMMASEWAGFLIPDGFEDFSTWPDPSDTEKNIWIKARHRKEKLVSNLDLHLSGSKSHLQKLSSLFHLAFPSPRYMQFAYPPASGAHLPLAYLRRIIKWMRNRNVAA